MDTLIIILIESIVMIVIGFPITYLIWILGGKKRSFGEFLNNYGYAIAVISLIVLGITFAAIKTIVRE